MRSKEVEYTRGGNKKGPSYQMLVNWCSSAWSELDPELIKRSFTQTGVSNTGSVDREVLHSRLRKLVVDGVMEDENEDSSDNDNLGSGELSGWSDNEEEEEEGERERALPDS